MSTDVSGTSREEVARPGIWLGTYRRLIAKGHDQNSAAYEADKAEKREHRARVAAEYRLSASPHEWTADDSEAMALYVFDAEAALGTFSDRERAPVQVDVERVAEVLMLYDLDMDGDWPANKVRGALAYRDSEHSGDCTKQPWTCMRCVCDQVYKVANAVAAALTPSLQTGGEGDND